MSIQQVDVVIVGAGMAGLTAAAYLTKANYSVVVIEKDETSGGLLGAFKVDGHLLDKGARGIIDSGIIFPMAKQLGLNIEFLENPIKMMVEDQAVTLRNNQNIDDYQAMLSTIYPQETENIKAIIADIKKVMKYMDVLYGIENPLFLPKPYDVNYLAKTLLPWMGRFIVNINKAMKLLDPINDHLRKYTSNEQLIHIITQHFFEQTPAFFALSYFTLYNQYNYPKGSTQAVIDAMVDLIQKQGGIIHNNQEVAAINAQEKTVTTKDNVTFAYRQCIWAADTTTLYQSLQDIERLPLKSQRAIAQKQEILANKKGADSILTLYVIVDVDALTFKDIFGPHSFYTKHKEGLSNTNLDQLKDASGNFVVDKDVIFDWITQYIKFNTFEISIPSLRDSTCSPANEATLILSTLFDYQLNQHIASLGYYEAFKQHVTQQIIEYFVTPIPDLKKHIKKTIVATPLTIKSRTNNHEGSVTGWSFANKPFPAEFQFLKVSKSVLTPIPAMKQAGQWTFNPAGVPVAVLTGKLAADAVEKDLKKIKKDK